MMKDQEVGLDPYFRYRGKNQTRLEAFTDAAFALAITLTLLSSSVPNTFAELSDSMQNLIPFGGCVVLVMIIWYQHYIFFLRYGLQDLKTIVLNTFLIFLILVYVYPLKFLFVVLQNLYVGLFTGNPELITHTFTNIVSYEDSRFLMIIYGLGAGLIFFTFAMMYRHALRQKIALELDEYEVFQSVSGLRVNLLMTSIPILSALIAFSGIFGAWNFLLSGMTYMLYPPVMILNGKMRERKRIKLVQTLNFDE